MNVYAVEGFEQWRELARALASGGVAPESVSIADAGAAQRALFGEAPPPPRAGGELRISRAFVDAARTAAHARDDDRWQLLYRVLWRMSRGGEPHLLEVAIDADVARLRALVQSVRRDAHKMKAFVRFCEVTGDEYAAWYRPDHRIVPLVAPFFAERFASMRWTIMTPDASVRWDGQSLQYGPGVPRRDAPAPDALTEMWRTYYGAVFNPARLNLAAMRAEMPKRRWQDLPETAIVPRLIQDSAPRVAAMVAGGRASAAPFLPRTRSLEALREAAAGCQGCALGACATQTVAGEGAAGAPLMLVGEQPGDQEDRAGRPFIGPAGQVLDRALAAAGIGRESLYLTNAVKHFKFRQRGKVRIHQRPTHYEVGACRPWLSLELELVAPRVVVCLGATAAHAVLGRKVAVSRERGVRHRAHGAGAALVTYHPSAVLRAGDAHGEVLDALVRDLITARGWLDEPRP